MATAKICDRCGALINPPNSGLYIIFGAFGTGGCRTGEGESKDLCGSCAMQLKKFLSEKPTQQGWRADNG